MKIVGRWLGQPLLVFGGVCAIVAYLGSINYAWTAWQPATCLPDRCFCEAIRPAVFRQPSNTWSSLGFVLAGLVVMRLGFNEATPAATRSNLLMQHRGLIGLFSLALVLIGVGSAFYHASLSFYGQFVDVFGMYLIATFMVMYSLARMYGRVRLMIVLYLVVNLALIFLLLYVPTLRRYAFGFWLLLGLGLEYRYTRQTHVQINLKPLQHGLVYMALAFGIWLLDISKTVCFAASWLQGHAVWHILGAISAFHLYLYYRSEQSGMITIHD